MKTKFEFADKFGFERKFGFAEFDNESNKELVVNVDYNKLIQFIKQNSGCNHFFKVDNFESKTKQQVLNEKQVQPSTKIDIGGEEVFVDGLLYGNIHVDLSQYKLEFDLHPERSVEHQYFYITYYEYEKDILAIKLRVKSYEYFERLCHYIGLDIGRFKEDVKKKYLTAYDQAKSLKMKYRILKLMPNYVIDSFSSKALEAILLSIARSDIKTVFRDDQEAVYQLLKALSRKSRNSYEFLNILIKPYYGTVILKSIITQFGDFRGDYLTKIIALVYMEWKQSLYSKPFLSVYNNRQNDGPSFLPYYSDKTIGFFHSNFNVSLIGKYVKASYSGDDMIYTLGDGSKKKDEIKANETFKYHPYYPVQIPLEQEGELKLASQVPAFFLYVKENKDFWGNALFGAEIALDVLTIFTGALAVSRFVHLIRLANRAKHLGRGTKAIRFARASAYIRLGGGLVEISAGGLSAFLKLFDVVEDPELKKDLHDLLLIMEIMSISADLPDLIRKTFKKQVGKVAKQKDKIQKVADDGLITQKDGEEFLSEVNILAGAKSRKRYAIWRVNLKAGEYNCANCAIAVDKILSGQPASAVPWTYVKKWKDGQYKNCKSYDEGTDINIIASEFGKKGFISDMSIDKIEKLLKPGQRGIVYGYVKGNTIAHVFNVTNEKGVVKFIDGQKNVAKFNKEGDKIESIIEATQKADLKYDIYKFLPTNF